MPVGEYFLVGLREFERWPSRAQGDLELFLSSARALSHCRVASREDSRLKE
jgi:hypothetical protein